jgi:hypothetical protein
MFGLRRFCFRSPERDRETMERRLALIQRVVRSAIAEAEGESKGLRTRLARTRRSVMSLLAQVQDREPDPACRAELTILERTVLAGEQSLPFGPGRPALSTAEIANWESPIFLCDRHRFAEYVPASSQPAPARGPPAPDLSTTAIRASILEPQLRLLTVYPADFGGMIIGRRPRVRPRGFPVSPAPAPRWQPLEPGDPHPSSPFPRCALPSIESSWTQGGA